MKKETRKRLSELILEELAERIRHDEALKEKLEPYTDLPVEKVADTLIKHIDLLLTEEFKDSLYENVKSLLAEQAKEAAVSVPPPEISAPAERPRVPEPAQPEATPVDAGEAKEGSDVSIMKHFSLKEPFPFEPFTSTLKPDDWFYLFGISYAPDSTGKGVPTKMLSTKSVDRANNILLVDSGDIRLYVSRLSVKDYTLDTTSRPLLTQHIESRYRFEHENILNLLRAEESLVVLPHWTIIQGLEEIIGRVEENYVDLLKLLVEIHDAAEWELELFAFDHHILQLPSITAGTKGRATPRRELKHPPGDRKSDVMVEKVIFREKSIAQDIHNQLLLAASKAKVDFMIKLDNAFMDDWKSILSARYAISKDKRKAFWQTVREVQEQYREYELMLKVRTKVDKSFKL